MVCKLREIGTGKWIFVPKTLVDVFNLDLYEYKICIQGGKDIIFKNIGKLEDKEQTKLDDFSKIMKGGQKKDG